MFWPSSRHMLTLPSCAYAQQVIARPHPDRTVVPPVAPAKRPRVAGSFPESSHAPQMRGRPGCVPRTSSHLPLPSGDASKGLCFFAFSTSPRACWLTCVGLVPPPHVIYNACVHPSLTYLAAIASKPPPLPQGGEGQRQPCRRKHCRAGDDAF